MFETRIRRFGCVVLISGIAAASAQDREVAPLPSLSPLINQVAPAVVNISVTELVEARRSPFGDRGGSPFLEEFQDYLDELPPERQAAGSGVIVDAELGYILTNHHVISEASEIRVVLTDNRSFDAMVIGSDPESDVAVLQIEADDLTGIEFASTDNLKVGDYVVAIGNPFGLGQTVTSGIVSALGRTSGYSDGNASYEYFIQTDASINVGNSGGALINLEGDLVGINSAIISRTGDSVGIGFAIPSEIAVSVMRRLLEFGSVPRGLLGVYMESVTPAFADDYGLAVDAGAIVMRVEPGSAAAAAGIQINDVITRVDDEVIANSNELRNTVAMKLPSQEVMLEVVRDGRQRSIQAVLGAKAPVGAGVAPRRDPSARPSVFEGIDLMAETGRDQGLRVLSIEDSASLQVRRSDLRAGDLITAVNQRRVRSVAEAVELTENLRNVVVEIERNSGPELIRLR
jgi:Do/DeqQ family serine protease